MTKRAVLYIFAAFTVAFNVALVFNQYLRYYTIQEHPKAAPLVRQTGYPLHAQAIERAKAITVLISNEEWGNVSRGTGILIDPLHVLTCAHLISSYDDDLWVFTSKGDLTKGKPVYGDKRLDLAVLELSKGIRVPAVAKFASTVRDGEPITIIGNALGAMRWFVSYGFVSGQRGEWVLTDGHVFHGDSGGPWINESGEIVAMSAWVLERNGIDLGMHGGINAPTIKQFLRDWNTASKFSGILSIILSGAN